MKFISPPMIWFFGGIFSAGLIDKFVGDSQLAFLVFGAALWAAMISAFAEADQRAQDEDDQSEEGEDGYHS